MRLPTRLPPNIVLGVFGGNLVGKRIHAGLGGFVRNHAGRTDSGNGGNIDNRSTAALSHGGKNAAAGEEHSFQIHGHDAVPRFFGEIQDVVIPGPNADIVVENVDSPVGFQSGIHELSAVFSMADVRLHGDAVSA